MGTTRVLIIEDEPAAAKYLRSILEAVDKDIDVIDIIDSVEDSIMWFKSHQMPDIVFMDIHLSDGESFRIFDEVSISTPIIFTTAYDQYALDAFKVSSIDYILKPVKEDDVRRALEKWKILTANDRNIYSDRLSKMVSNRRNHTFLIRFRDKLIPVETSEIAFFHTCEEKVFLYTCNGNKYQIEQTLESLSGMLSEEMFFRANRQFIVSRGAIGEISVWFGSRLQVKLVPEAPERIIISKARVPEFKSWLSSNSGK